jgi:predicted XRE-type DNA-binding protein
MKRRTMKRHKGKSWVETDVEELLDLSDEDLVIVEFRAALALALQRARKRKRLTQAEAAEVIGTSQAQVSKMEAGQSSITLDRLIKALASLGVSRPAILRALNTAA